MILSDLVATSLRGHEPRPLRNVVACWQQVLIWTGREHRLFHQLHRRRSQVGRVDRRHPRRRWLHDRPPGMGLPPAGENFVERMDRAMRDSLRTIAVVSRDYYRSAYAVPEWTNAVTRDPTGRRGVLLPVRIDDVILEGIFAAVTWIYLAGIDHDEARKRLVEGVKRERVRPSGTPGFPEGQRPRYPGALPPVWRVPHDRNPVFAGRDDILSQLRQRLAEIRAQPAIAALTGTGGVGKTAIAAEYCYRASTDYQVVWWARAARRDFAAADLAALAEPLGLSKNKGSDSPRDLAADLAEARQWLAQHDQWLLALDEAENEEVSKGVVPQGGGGHVLLTSRSPAWRRQAAVVLEVPMLEPTSSLKLLQIRTGLEPGRDAGLLAEALGRLPLGLELAGAFIERQGISFGDYLRRLKKAGGVPEGGAPPDYRHTLATVWSESLGSLEQLAPEAGDLLRLCATWRRTTFPDGSYTRARRHCPSR
jgi:hypothetical protein